MVKLTRYNGNRVDCDRQIAEAGQRMATAREGMLDRIAQGLESHYKTKGCWHPEGTARIDGKTYWCLGEFAPTTHYAQRTLDSNLAGNYLALTEDIKLGDKPASEIIKQLAEKDAKRLAEKKIILIPSNQSNSYTVQTEDLGDVDVVRFLARSPKLAEDYGKFLKNKCGINSLNICQLSSRNEGQSAGFWLSRFGDGDGSGFDGNGRYFGNGGGSSFGVRARSASASSLALPTYAKSPQGANCELSRAKKGIHTSILEANVLDALNGKKAFKYKGIFYVPVKEGVFPV